MSSANSGVVTCQQRVCPLTSMPLSVAQSTILSHGRKSYTPCFANTDTRNNKRTNKTRRFFFIWCFDTSTHRAHVCVRVDTPPGGTDILPVLRGAAASSSRGHAPEHDGRDVHLHGELRKRKWNGMFRFLAKGLLGNLEAEVKVVHPTQRRVLTTTCRCMWSLSERTPARLVMKKKKTVVCGSLFFSFRLKRLLL